MLDFTQISLDNLIIHKVGNKFKDEGFLFSNKELRINDENIKALLLKYFFSSFNEEKIYCFSHETDIKFNEVYSYSKELFEENTPFVDISINISKLLYESSNHPNIKKGELYIAYIRNCILDGTYHNAIGIFKSENKDTYLKIEEQPGNIGVNYEKGININKLDKGCLILNTNMEKGYKIYIVDSSSKGEEALYWKNNFLNLKSINNDITYSNNLIKAYKEYTDIQFKDDKKEKIMAINECVSYIDKNEQFNSEEFCNTVLKTPIKIETFKEVVQTQIEKGNAAIPEAFQISVDTKKKIKRKLHNSIKLDNKIEIKISSNTEIAEVLEKGYDNDKKMYFYKVYFTDEN